MEGKRCGGCRHFTPITGLDGNPRRELMGHCEKVRSIPGTAQRKHPDTLAVALGYGGVSGYMLVDWEFGCVMWEGAECKTTTGD